MPDYLKGFSGAGYFLVGTNTTGGYSTTGVRTTLEGAVSCSKSDTKSTNNIAGDDNPAWDVDVEWTGTTLTTVFREVPLEKLKDLTGCEISEDGTYEEGTLDSAPPMALTFRGLKRTGGYRCYRYYNAVLTSYNYTLNTKGSGNTVADVTLEWNCMPRAVDNKMRGTKDFATAAAANAWLNETITQGAVDDKPPMAYFNKIERISATPAVPEMRVLYVLTGSVTVSSVNYAAGDSLYYDGKALQPYTVAGE